MKKIEIITDKETLEQFVNRQDIDILDVDIKATEQSAFCQQYFVAVIYYEIEND